MVQGIAAVGAAAVASASIEVSHPKQKAWERKWLEVEIQLQKLEDYYASRRPGFYHVEIEMLAEGYFRLCRELADALWEHHTAGGLDKNTVMAFVRSDPDLRVVDGMAQTIKHNKRIPDRRNPDPISAWIESYNSATGLPIRWESHSGAIRGQMDALVLARRCHAAWGRFLRQRGLQ
jgi:hypothetical protein